MRRIQLAVRRDVDEVGVATRSGLTTTISTRFERRIARSLLSLRTWSFFFVCPTRRTIRRAVQFVPIISIDRTFVSGIEPHHIHPELKRLDVPPHESPPKKRIPLLTFAQARSAVRTLFDDPHVTMVGHGLQNDFKALSLKAGVDIACSIEDSATDPLLLRKDGRPDSLKTLCRDILGVSTQEKGKSHCPVEDAWNALRLHVYLRDLYRGAVPP